MRSFGRYINYYKTILRFFWKECDFWRQKCQQGNFYENKSPVIIDDIDINKILISKKEPYGTKKLFKYLTG